MRVGETSFEVNDNGHYNARSLSSKTPLFSRKTNLQDFLVDLAKETCFALCEENFLYIFNKLMKLKEKYNLKVFKCLFTVLMQAKMVCYINIVYMRNR